MTQRRGAEMLVHLMRAGEEIPEILRADGDHDRQADGAPQRVATADPVPEAEHPVRGDAEVRRPRRARSDTAAKWCADAPLRRAVGDPARAPWRRWSWSRAVVKVLDAMMNSVVSGSSGFSVSAMWAPSMLET